MSANAQTWNSLGRQPLLRRTKRPARVFAHGASIFSLLVLLGQCTQVPQSPAINRRVLQHSAPSIPSAVLARLSDGTFLTGGHIVVDLQQVRRPLTLITYFVSPKFPTRS
jgi:hypothetical protein